jgi:hypothetical protein
MLSSAFKFSRQHVSVSESATKTTLISFFFPSFADLSFVTNNFHTVTNGLTDGNNDQSQPSVTALRVAWLGFSLEMFGVRTLSP